MKKKYALIISMILFTIFITACASSELLIKKPLEVKLNQYTNFVFQAKSSVADDVSGEITDLEAAAIKRVQELKLFKTTELGDSVKVNNAEGTLFVKAVITDINKVSGLTRFLIGAFAGKASMTIDVSFIDAKTGKSIGEFSITGKSGGTGYAGGTSEAIDMTVNKIVEVVSQNYQ